MKVMTAIAKAMRANMLASQPELASGAKGGDTSAVYHGRNTLMASTSDESATIAGMVPRSARSGAPVAMGAS